MPNLTPDTRGRILRAADAVFASDGLRAGSMDRIAAHAGVTKRTLYYHFRSKDDLIAACLSERGTPLADRICNLSGGDRGGQESVSGEKNVERGDELIAVPSEPVHHRANGSPIGLHPACAGAGHIPCGDSDNTVQNAMRMGHAHSITGRFFLCRLRPRRARRRAASWCPLAGADARALLRPAIGPWSIHW